jgi:urease alpha subunit
MKKIAFLSMTLILLTALALTGVAARGLTFTTTLSGAAEIPGPGDPDGTGTATITLDPGSEMVCWEIHVSGITLPASAAHIHFINPETGFGGVLVGLSAPDDSGHASGCTSTSRENIVAILSNPEGYYVNVHNSDYPSGALRGDLSR